MGTEEVIALALLLGSDYTEGVRGVGIVNAMEVRAGRDKRALTPTPTVGMMLVSLRACPRPVASISTQARLRTRGTTAARVLSVVLQGNISHAAYNTSKYRETYVIAVQQSRQSKLYCVCCGTRARCCRPSCPAAPAPFLASGPLTSWNVCPNLDPQTAGYQRVPPGGQGRSPRPQQVQEVDRRL